MLGCPEIIVRLFMHVNYIILVLYHSGRRKFRSETSDNMDSWKAEVRRVRSEKDQKKEDAECAKR